MNNLSSKIDCHAHTLYSPDGSAAADDMVKAAIKAGFKHFAITDHRDRRDEGGFVSGVDDLNSYAKTLFNLKQKYAGKIYISVGLEVGFTPHGNEQTAKLLKDSGIEFVINSVHDVHGRDCYYSHYYDGRTKKESYGEYLDVVYDSLDSGYGFDSVGHLGYIERCAPYADGAVTLKEFGEVLDKILLKIIEKNVILELNTSTGKALHLPFVPNPDILKRYKELGGRNITFSSDAHRTEDIGRKYEIAAAAAKSIGFKYYTIKQNGELVKTPI